MKTYAELGAAIGGLVQRKNVAYGDSITKTGEFLRLLYPEGLRPDQYDDVALLARLFDKQMRIATDRDALGESPYEDIAGYGILGAHMQWQKKEIGACPGNASGAVTQSESGPRDSAASNAKKETAPSSPRPPAHEPLQQPDGCSSPLESAAAAYATASASPSAAGQPSGPTRDTGHSRPTCSGKEQPMTSKEKVLSVYPDAWRGLTGVFIVGHGITDAIKIGRSWDDAASKLPSAPSPAGETASELPKCLICGGDTPRGFHIDCEESAAVPEPVPTEVLGTCADFPNTPHAKGSCESCDMWTPVAAPIAPAAEEWKSFTISRIAAQNSLVREYLDKRDARLRKAEELIQELKKALEPFPGNPRFSDEDGDEWWCMCCDASARLGSEIKHDEDCMIGRAITALARAEEYRKGAKQ